MDKDKLENVKKAIEQMNARMKGCEFGITERTGADGAILYYLYFSAPNLNLYREEELKEHVTPSSV